MLGARVEALVIARVHASAQPLRAKAIVDALVRYTPATVTEAAWRDRLDQTIEELRARGVLDGKLQLVERGALARAIGKHAARSWQQLTGKVLPALGLGVAADDGKTLARLAGRDAWTAAIMARALGLWTAGPPPALAAVCDAFAWQTLGLPGKPKRCPPEVRAVFVQRALGADPGTPERQVRLYAAKVVGSPRAELGALLDGLVRRWTAGQPIGADAGDAAPPVERPFVDEVREVASTARAGVFGDRKVFIAAVWNELRRQPGWSALSLADFKARLVDAHRAGVLALARADHVAALDPELVATSETLTEGASFHFIVREAS